MENILFLFFLIAVLGVIFMMIRGLINILKDSQGCPVTENALDKETYIILSETFYENEIYLLLKGESKIVTCWVSQKEGFKNFDYSDESILLVPKNNS